MVIVARIDGGLPVKDYILRSHACCAELADREPLNYQRLEPFRSDS